MTAANPMLVKRIALAPQSVRTIRDTVLKADDGAETGGILLGRIQHDGSAHVRHAGTPGPAAKRSPTYFLRDLAHAQDLADRAFKTDGSIWIGEWHTHVLTDPVPSARDLATYCDLLANPILGFDVVLAIVVGPTRPTPPAVIHIAGWACTRTGVAPVPIESAELFDMEGLRRT